MAPLEVIGAGFGRTGTNSLCLALNILGYKTHHMKELIRRPELDPSAFTEAYKHPEKQADWDKIYEDYNAAVDHPTCVFVESLMKKYPDAKIILTVRSPESWYKSVKNTIYQANKTMRQQSQTNPHMAKLLEMTNTVFVDGVFADENKMEDEEYLKSAFIKHNEWVKANVPADRLLVMELGDGWEKLCLFLGKEIPKEPYPRSNSTEEFELMRQAILSGEKDLQEAVTSSFK